MVERIDPQIVEREAGDTELSVQLIGVGVGGRMRYRLANTLLALSPDQFDDYLKGELRPGGFGEFTMATQVMTDMYNRHGLTRSVMMRVLEVFSPAVAKKYTRKAADPKIDDRHKREWNPPREELPAWNEYEIRFLVEALMYVDAYQQRESTPYD